MPSPPWRHLPIGPLAAFLTFWVGVVGSTCIVFGSIVAQLSGAVPAPGPRRTTWCLAEMAGITGELADWLAAGAPGATDAQGLPDALAQRGEQVRTLCGPGAEGAARAAAAADTVPDADTPRPLAAALAAFEAAQASGAAQARAAHRTATARAALAERLAAMGAELP